MENETTNPVHKKNDILELFLEKSRSSSTESIPVIAHADDGRVVLFDRNSPLSFKLKPGQKIRARITKISEKYYVAAPLTVLQPESSTQKLSAYTFPTKIEEKPMDMKTVLDSIRQSEEGGRKLLGALLNEGKIVRESYEAFLKLNTRLARNLLSIFETENINSIPYLLKLYKKPLDFHQAFEMMKVLILEGSQDPKSSEIKKMALKIGKKRMLIKYNSEKLPEIDKMYSHKIPKEDYNNFLINLGLCTDVANALYAWLIENIAYVSDPPLEYFQPALTTLKIKGGDCDDYTILACSMYRSIGFKTYIGFKRKHTYPGILFVVPEEGKQNNFINISRIFLPLDREAPFNPFDILPKAYEEGIEDYYRELGEYSQHKIFEVDPELGELE